MGELFNIGDIVDIYWCNQEGGNMYGGIIVRLPRQGDELLYVKSTEGIVWGINTRSNEFDMIKLSKEATTDD